jgi:hypothetical protein
MPNSDVASPQKSEQEQHQAAEEQHMDQVADCVHAHHAEQPHSKQNERDFEQHVASEAQPATTNVAGCLIEVAADSRLNGCRGQMLRAGGSLDVSKCSGGPK